MLTFLEANGIMLEATNSEVAETGLAVASGTMDYEAHYCRFSRPDRWIW